MDKRIVVGTDGFARSWPLLARASALSILTEQDMM